MRKFLEFISKFLLYWVLPVFFIHFLPAWIAKWFFTFLFIGWIALVYGAFARYIERMESRPETFEQVLDKKKERRTVNTLLFVVIVFLLIPFALLLVGGAVYGLVLISAFFNFLFNQWWILVLIGAGLGWAWWNDRLSK